jgi:hypothetical protein
MQRELWLYSKRVWPVVFIYLLLAAALLCRFQVYPSVVRNTDALGYINIGLAIREHGLLSDLRILSTQRTYGYPLMVYLYSLIGGIEPLRIALAAGISQLTIYGIAVLFLASRISTYSRTFAHSIAIGLLLNPVVVALVADVLSESATLIIVVLALCCLFNCARAQTAASILLWAIIGAALTNFSMMIRPSNIFVVAAWNGAFLLQLGLSRKEINRRVLLLTYAGGWVLSAAIAWTPQYLYNASLGAASILPVYPLFDAQIKWGIILLKYATVVVSDYAEPFMFINPWCVPNVPNVQPGIWYLEHPAQGILTIAGHIFHAFNVEFPFTYVYDPNPIYSLPVSFAMWFVTVIGMFNGLGKNLEFFFHGRPVGFEQIGLVVMIDSLVLMVISLNSFLAVETRFNSLPIAATSVLAVEFFLSYRSQHRALKSLLVSGAIGVALVSSVISEMSRTTAVAAKFSGAGYSSPCMKQ